MPIFLIHNICKTRRAMFTSLTEQISKQRFTVSSASYQQNANVKIVLCQYVIPTQFVRLMAILLPRQILKTTIWHFSSTSPTIDFEK